MNQNTQSQSPLQQFLVDKNELNEAKLADLLHLYLLGIDKRTGEPIFSPAFENLDSQNKILCYLLTNKVSFHLGKRSEEEASPSEIGSITNIPGNTVRPVLKKLRDTRFIASKGSNYYVPNLALNLIDLGKRNEISKRNITIGGKTIKKNLGKNNSTFLLDQEKYQNYIDFLTRKGKYLERSLLVLKIARDQGIDGLTPNQLDNIFRDQFRAPISKANISYVLGKNSAATARELDPNGKGYIYKIMKRGEDIVREYSGGVTGMVTERS